MFLKKALFLNFEHSCIFLLALPETARFHPAARKQVVAPIAEQLAQTHSKWHFCRLIKFQQITAGAGKGLYEVSLNTYVTVLEVCFKCKDQEALKINENK